MLEAFLSSCRRLGTAAASDLYDIEDRLGAAPACPQPPWGMSRTDGAERRGSRPVSPDLRQTGGKGRRLALSNHHERIKSRRSLGADHHLTLLNKITLAAGVTADPERTRDNPVFESTHIRAAGTTFFVPTQAKTCSKPISWCRTCSRGDGESSDPRMRTRLKQSPCCPDCAHFFERLADVDSV